jgi:hypothetical protein
MPSRPACASSDAAQAGICTPALLRDPWQLHGRPVESITDTLNERPSGWLSIGSEGGLEPIQNGNLRRLQLVTRPVELEPFDAVDLREGLHAPRPARPLHPVGIADRGCGVQVSLGRPRQDELSRLLPDLTKLDERGYRGARGRFPPRTLHGRPRPVPLLPRPRLWGSSSDPGPS